MVAGSDAGSDANARDGLRVASREDGAAMIAGKRVLLLQGPPGPFFHRLSKDLQTLDCKVFKINFNGGDWLFYRKGAKAYRGDIQGWPGYLREAVQAWRADVILLYGDCRPVHETVFEMEDELGVDIYTFEEGYLRPDFVTLERGRTNGFSSLPRSSIAYLNGPEEETPEEYPVGYSFYHLALWGMLYHAAAAILAPFHPCKTYHRGIGVSELLPQLRSFWRKALYAWLERGKQDMLTTRLSGKYFLVPLQVNSDSQIRCHSDFATEGMRGFIRYVMESFARAAPRDLNLVFKHHPMDRGYHDHTAFVRELAGRLGLKGRVFCVHDLHLPSLIDHSLGVTVVNSTVGLSAIMHGKPVKTHGNAMYDMPGLTAQISLDDFWRHAAAHVPDAHLAQRFRAAIIARTQINGNFYRRLTNTPLKCGLSNMHLLGMRNLPEVSPELAPVAKGGQKTILKKR